MFSTQLKQFIKLERLLSGLMGVLFGLLLSVLSEWLVRQQQAWLVGVLIAGMIIIAVVWFVIHLRHPFKDIDVAIQSPHIIRSDAQRQKHARRGFICFVPLYRPARNSPATQLSPEEREKAIEDCDFEKLDIEHSNLIPTIKAITQHASKLEYCWLLTTSSANSPGSTPYAPVLARYLRERTGLSKCKFLISEIHNIQMDDDALVLNNTYDCVKDVFTQATQMGLKPQDIIVDFSSGVRSMVLGMILASLNGDRDIEFMGTHYDKNGLPKQNELFPIIFSFNPQLTSE